MSQTPTDDMVDAARFTLSGICGFEITAQTVRKALESALAVAPAPAELSVVVKPLEWNPYRAETPFGWYDINDQSDVPESELKGRPPFLLCGSRMDYSRHGTLDAARSAAQADYEARIRSALSVSEVEGCRGRAASRDAISR